MSCTKTALQSATVGRAPLSMHICAWQEAMDMRDVGIQAHSLLLWLEDGPRMDFQRGRRHWHTEPKKGRLDYYPPCSIDILRSAGAGRVLVLEIPEPFIAGLASENEGELMLPAEPEHQFRDARLENILHRIHAGDPQEPLGIHAVSLLEERLLTHGRRATRPFTSRRRRLLQKYIDEHLASDLELSALASASGYSLGHFLRVFKMAFGEPPHQYILNRRIERAKESLASSDTGLSDLAYQLGFSSHAHFSTAFRLRTGTTPHQFRRALGGRLSPEAGLVPLPA